MTTHFSAFRSFLLLAAIWFGSAAEAQQMVCMSLHNGPATGLNSLGAPGQVAGRVNGTQVSVPTAPGMTTAAASAAHQAAFAAANFTTVRINPGEFCVIAGPGGTPITSGLCYGTDDMGLDLDSSVRKILPPAGPAGGPDDPTTKPGGVVVPLPPVQQPPRPFSGQIQICFDVWVNGVRVRICITIQLAPNQSGGALQQQMEQQLLQQGFLSNRVQIPDPLNPTQLVSLLQIDRMVGGQVVDGVEYQYDAMSRRIIPSITGAGVWPTFGATEYGVATQGAAAAMPWSRLGAQPPRINGFFDVFHEVQLPNLPGGVLINLVRGSAPLLNGTLLVDPAAAVFEFGVSDATGVLHRGFTLPNNAGLIGLPLHLQGGVLHPSGQLTLSTGIRAVIGA